MPSGKCLLQLALSSARRVRMVSSDIQGGIPRELTLTDIEDTEPLTSSPRLGIGTWSNRAAIVAGDATADRITSVDRIGRAEQLPAHTRTNCLSAYHCVEIG